MSPLTFPGRGKGQIVVFGTSDRQEELARAFTQHVKLVEVEATRGPARATGGAPSGPVIRPKN